MFVFFCLRAFFLQRTLEFRGQGSRVSGGGFPCVELLVALLFLLEVLEARV